MVRVGEYRVVGAGQLWRIALLTAAGAIGATSQAEAALYYWSDSDSGYYRPGPTVRQKPRRHQAKKIEAPVKESAKPQGPVIIAISIEKQKLKIYDANGFFAEAPVSTGMKGHPTPTGVFSVIQKQKLHHSNIYSGAPMPYMQRITWSGIAIHAGVLPGYPASHGCIRMPMAFAMKMWNWTRMGARVVVTPGEMTPASFSHPLLVTQKVAPQPASEPQADAPPAPKSDKASEADTPIKPATSEAKLELRSTVGHADRANPIIGEPPASASLREQTHTADASGAMPASRPAVASEQSADASKTDVKAEAANSQTATSEAEPAAAKPEETASSDDKPAEAKPSDAAIGEIKSPETTTGEAGKQPDQAVVAAQPATDAAKADVSATGSTIREEKSADKPGDAAKAVTAIGPSVPDAKKDQTRLPDTAKPAAGKTDPAAATAPKRTGQIAVFISRKDSKLYVRQNFAALFDAPVTIAPSDRPLGTHVFTAEIDKNNANVVHWSVVSLPSRRAQRRDEDERGSRRRKTATAAIVAPKPSPVPDSPGEALDRITISADTMARITDALSTGASIIVSDQGISAGETGEGTDFIVSLR
jgi:lipoprotein-anchoring transpeptidase ErfK/SrfK